MAAKVTQRRETAEMSEGGLDDDPFEIAREKSWRVVIPEPNELQLDYDVPEEAEMVVKTVDAQRIIDRLNGAGLGLKIVKTTRSPGGNHHVYVQSDVNLDPMARIIIQLLLGSDPMREMLSFLRIHTGAKRPPTLLYEKNEEPIK
jgi:hypothetical protein